MNILFHLIILNPLVKERIKDFIKQKYDVIDLDYINEEVLNQETFQKTYKKYLNFKEKKNDNFKEIDKKLTSIWENSVRDTVEQNIPEKKKVVVIGFSHHYRILSKKIEFDTNKFFLDDNIKKTTKNIVKKNLNDNFSKIIAGAYLLDNIDYHHIKKKLNLIKESYIKSNYILKTEEEIFKIVNLSTKKINSNGLWISLKDDYKINSLIHPTKNYIYSYLDPVYSLLSSIKFSKDLEKSYNNNKVHLKINNYDKCRKKMSTKRYLYLIEKKGFIPFEKGKNIKFFSQSPAKILDKEEISNVYQKFKEINII
tara:strand:- start:1628 stop:2560 length:933 start_codon:yes stop_codon:yes gene_type:complete